MITLFSNNIHITLLRSHRRQWVYIIAVSQVRKQKAKSQITDTPVGREWVRIRQES